MGECKHENLPKVVMAKDFDKGWEDYMTAYKACKPEDFLAEMQEILDTFK
jgi:putative aldouronate transport system substrate-binding protein